ncbi:ATP-binding cassette domain-containing protein [Enterococcus ratti]|uniref:ABC transporter domain-containing protein n=1 Tax=Enterococcus ratti TaxID=150033 RepID=A0A1L8WNT8_9ENTE|nr:ATP-binding cassette domain-containing protein [Enterococcus ratti]OJG82698.1 hypothetical protein RV14_GL002273 [Enterococcus ratti]
MEIFINNLIVKEKNTDNQLLKELNFRLNEKQIQGIIGPSGSGKTTLLHVLAGVSHPTLQVHGSFTWTKNGEKEKEKFFSNTHSLRKQFSMGYIPQNAMNIFDPIETMQHQLMETFCENGWSKKEANEKISCILNDFQLDQSILTRYPHELSGGILQRCTIGIALQLKPQILLADEPTSSVDQEVKQIILDEFKEYSRKNNAMIVLTTHDYSVIQQLCDQLLILENGCCHYMGDTKTAEQEAAFYSEIKNIHEKMETYVKELLNE